MEIQRLNQNIKWQQLTAKEILKYKQEGEEVPNEYQKWASAISAVMNVQDDVTYEMVNGETDIAALDEALGRNNVRQTDIQPTNEAENNIGRESEEAKDEEPTPVLAQEEAPETPPAQERDDITLADEAITTDPNEILKRKQRKGIQPLS